MQNRGCFRQRGGPEISGIDLCYGIVWSCTTITTVGYGDITPQTDAGRLFVFFAMIVGAGMYGYIIAAMGNIVADLSVVSSMRRKRMMELSLFMDSKGLPSELRAQVRESYRFWLERMDMFHEEKILKALPHDLRDCRHALHKEDIQRAWFFC